MPYSDKGTPYEYETPKGKFVVMNKPRTWYYMWNAWGHHEVLRKTQATRFVTPENANQHQVTLPGWENNTVIVQLTK